jgi:hypothetical protein
MSWSRASPCLSFVRDDNAPTLPELDRAPRYFSNLQGTVDGTGRNSMQRISRMWSNQSVASCRTLCWESLETTGPYKILLPLTLESR